MVCCSCVGAQQASNKEKTTSASAACALIVKGKLTRCQVSSLSITLAHWAYFAETVAPSLTFRQLGHAQGPRHLSVESYSPLPQRAQA